MGAEPDTPPLVCPGCGRSYPADERFCAYCEMPLVLAPGIGVEAELTERQAWARKIKRQYAEGELTRVAGARNQTEAEFIQNLLLEEGVPSLLRRTAGFDVPDYLAAGPRDVLVPASGAEAAHEILLDADLAPRDGGGVELVPPWKVLVGLLIGIALIAALALALGA